MNSLAAITWKDIVEKHVHGLSEMRKAIITKGLGEYECVKNYMVRTNMES